MFAFKYGKYFELIKLPEKILKLTWKFPTKHLVHVIFCSIYFIFLFDKFTVVIFVVAVSKLMEVHGEGTSAPTKGGGEGETSEKVARPDNYEPPVLTTV